MPFMDKCCPARECANPSAKSDCFKQENFEFCGMSINTQIIEESGTFYYKHLYISLRLRFQSVGFHAGGKRNG